MGTKDCEAKARGVVGRKHVLIFSIWICTKVVYALPTLFIGFRSFQGMNHSTLDGNPTLPENVTSSTVLFPPPSISASS